MTWVQTYCGTDSPAVLSPTNPLAFTPCFLDAVLLQWDVAVFFLGLLVLSCQPSKRIRVALHPPRLPSFQRVLLVLLTILPLLSLLAAVSEHSATPSRIVSRVLRSLTWGTTAVLLGVYITPSRWEGLWVMQRRVAQWLQSYVLLALVSAAFAVYEGVVEMMAEPQMTMSAVIVLLTTVTHCALALTSLSTLTALSHPTPVPQHLHLQAADRAAEDEELWAGGGDDDVDYGCLSSFTFSWVDAHHPPGPRPGCAPHQ